MVEHILKTLPDYWDAINRGEKNFEVRRDDRGFQKGDTLILYRLIRHPSGRLDVERSYTNNMPREIRRKITYILTGGQLGIEPGYVVMGLKKA